MVVIVGRGYSDLIEMDIKLSSARVEVDSGRAS